MHAGDVLIAGDAIGTAEHLERDLWTHCPDPETARQSARDLQRLAAENDALLLYGDDMDQWEELRLSPRFYD
jgi:glyoxylase-like metal-dependent hydrolase (beta-lactamase superfamily II)